MENNIQQVPAGQVSENELYHAIYMNLRYIAYASPVDLNTSAYNDVFDQLRKLVKQVGKYPQFPVRDYHANDNDSIRPLNYRFNTGAFVFTQTEMNQMQSIAFMVVPVDRDVEEDACWAIELCRRYKDDEPKPPVSKFHHSAIHGEAKNFLTLVV